MRRLERRPIARPLVDRAPDADLSWEAMSYEVEIKYRAPDHRALRRRLLDLGAEEDPAIDQEDHYLAHPSRDFARSDEAFRLRRVGDSNRITYKGPKHAGPTKTREEIEVPFGDGPDALDRMATVLDRLGFRPVATIRKTRNPFHLKHLGRHIEVVLDTALGLGTFAEVEAIAAGPGDLPDAQAAVLDLARRLGLDAVEPRSYLRMTLEATDPPGP